MDLNFDRLRKIYLEQGEDGLLKEKERLLMEYLSTLPVEKQNQAKLFIRQVEYELRGLNTEERLKKLSSMLIENLFDLTDGMCDLVYLLQNDNKKK
jgi:vacuolar-type H+-ATPase subunit E/Vma4